jgi:hypothetical protein
MDNAYSSNEMVFIPAIRVCIANVCDETANIQTILKRSVYDPNGGYIPDNQDMAAYQDFVYHLDRLFCYCEEFLPAELRTKISAWVDGVNISNDLSASKDHISQGIEISKEFQTILFEFGLKDTTVSFDVFPFELYKEINDKRISDYSDKTKNFNPAETALPEFEIIGFSSKSEYSFLYTNYSQRSFYLLSEGRIDDARTFFYNILGDFAPVFDETFLKNCIEISNSFFKTKEGTVSKTDYQQAYQMHKAEFSRLMIRANIHQQPDIMDTKQPNYTPADKVVI